MTNIKIDVQWSPNHEDKFLTFGTDLNLYKIEQGPLPAAKCTGAIKISDDSHASLLSVNSDNQYLKCLAWHPHKEWDHLLAAGLANGRVVLTSFGKGGPSDPYCLIGKEFIPKHARQCNYVAWNPLDCYMLVSGLEKYRADYSIMIWDVNAKTGSEFLHERKLGAANSESNYTRPMIELGPSETTHSLAWFIHEPKTLVTGMNNKFLRIFDLRDTSRPQSVAYTKSVYGVKVDPHGEYRLASFHEGQLAIWDTRNFDKPVLTKSENKAISKVSWSPTRNGLLACLTKDSSIVRLYDIQHSSLGSDDLEPAVIERIIQATSQQHHLSSFDWHPTNENRLLTVSMAGAIKDLTIFERIAISWSPDIYLTWACGRQIKQCHSIKLCREASEDISIKMKRRALKGYGLKDSCDQNAAFVLEEPQLKNLWYWIDALKEHYSQDTDEIPPLALVSTSKSTMPPRPRPRQLLGVQAMVTGTQQGNGAMLDYWQWQGVETTDSFKFRLQKKVFRSDSRLKALELCGWGFEKDSPSSLLIDRYENAREYERAAAVAVFTLKLKRAIQVLNNGAKLSQAQGEDSHLNMVAMALSGFSDEKKTLWKEMCGNLSGQLQSPCLRAMFAFLTSDSETYDDILNESEVPVVDRVGFACMYLNDAKLADYINKLATSLASVGNLDGILLTGLTVDSLDLFQQYVDITGDVQTASLAVIQAFPNSELSKHPRVCEWIESYRALLDQWSLWHQRAEFDVYKNNFDRATVRPQAQVYVSCTYCGKAISYNPLATRNRHFMFGSAAAMNPKISSCPSCRKALPRCSLCLINMGTAAGSGKSKPLLQDIDQSSMKLTQFKEWFTWCQSCRHGGHAEHMAQWYGESSECPVTGCNCKCSTLDMLGSLLSDLTKPLSPTPSH